jgi:regulator of PEP synthase PpsR (kinase-PPPase family)
MGEGKKKVHLFVVSDATGMTAEQVIGAALVQFRNIEPEFSKFSYVSTEQELIDILSKAESLEALVIYSLASLELRTWFRQERRKRNVYTLDLLGPPLKLMEKLWKISPDFRSGIFKGTRNDTMRLAESIDFTLKHDDGQNLDTIDRADLIILGISRTSKTPSSLYLSCNFNLKVANYPIIVNEALPEKIPLLPCKKVGFTIEPKRALYIREARFLNIGKSEYTEIEAIRKELRYCLKIFRKIPGLRVIDVTHRSIEEIAGQIVEEMSAF